MSKQEEIKQALADLKLGHWHKADFDAKAPEYIAYLLATVEGLEASKEIEIECHVQSCLDYQSQLQTLNEENERLRKELEEVRQSSTEEAVQADAWHELYLGAQKELEEARKALGWYADASNYVKTKLWPGDPACTEESEVSEDGGERARAFLVGLEEEGEQA